MWTTVFTFGLTKAVPAVFKVLKHKKRYGDCIKAIRRAASQLKEANEDGVITPYEKWQVALTILEAIVEFAEAIED